MGKMVDYAEGAAAIGGLALEVGGFAVGVVGDKVKEFAQDPQENSKALIENVTVKGKELLDKSAQAAKANPIPALAVGAGVGLLLLLKILK